MNREWKSDKLEYSNTEEPTNLTTLFERENLTTIVQGSLLFSKFEFSIKHDLRDLSFL